MKTFDEFINEKRFITNINSKFLKFAFMVSYRKAIKHFTKLHEKITEDHVLEFINHYMINYYGIDLAHSPDVYRYIKIHIHHKFINKKKDEDISEGFFGIGNLFLKPFYVSFGSKDEHNTIINYLKNNGFRHWISHSGRINLYDDLVFVDVKKKISYDSDMMGYFGNMGEYDIITFNKFLSGKYDTKEYKDKKAKLKKLKSDIDPYGEEKWEDEN